MTGPALAAGAADLVDLGDVARMLRRGWRLVLGVLALALGAAAAVLAFAPRRFEGDASMVVRSSPEASSSLLGRLGLPTDLAPAAVGSALKSPLETELQILASRAVLGPVSDSLGLAVRVVSPRGLAPWQLLHPGTVAPSFRRRRIEFTRDGASWHATGAGVDARVAPGGELRTPVGTYRLAAAPLPDRFTVELLDREDALEKMSDRLSVAKPGGDVVRLTYAAPDSLSAAAVPNTIIAVYLDRRRTSDRGVNEHRAEFLARQVDSTNRELASAERALRQYRETSRIVDPEIVGKLDLEAATKVREQLAANDVESQALGSLLAGVRSGAIAPRQLAAYPTFLRSPAINEILGQLTKLETERTALRERRTDTDPEVVALTTSIRDLEQQLLPLGTAYASSLAEQRRTLGGQAARYDAEIGRLPASAEAFVRLDRQVRLLGQASLGLQTQLLDARLSAIGEGGDVRRLDLAELPKRPKFPRPIPTLAVALGGGLLLGLVLALGVGFFSARVEDAATAARVSGLPAAALGRGSPRFFAMLGLRGELSVAPLDDRARAVEVARWLRTSSAHDELAAVPLARARATAGTIGNGRGAAIAERGPFEGDHADAGPSSDGILPPLDDATAMRALRAEQRVVLAVARGARQDDVLGAIDALRLAGAIPVGIVLT